MVLVTVPVAVSILDTEPDPLLVTYAVRPSGVTATPTGVESTVMVLVTVPVAVLILDTEPDPLLAAYTVLPSGVTATPAGRKPTAMVLVTVPVAVSILDTESDSSLVTYAVFPSGVTATPNGPVPTVMVLVTVSLSLRREERVPGTLILFRPSAAAGVCVHRYHPDCCQRCCRDHDDYYPHTVFPGRYSHEHTLLSLSASSLQELVAVPGCFTLFLAPASTHLVVGVVPHGFLAPRPT